jgi:hypothetical protein
MTASAVGAVAVCTVVHGATITVDGRDSAAISTAIEQAQAGDEVQLPEGTYSISEPIRLKSGIQLIGAGQERTVLRFAADQAGPMVLLTGCEDVEVAHLTLDGAGSPLARQGVYASDSRRLNVHHVTVRDLAKGEGFGPHGIHFNGHNPTREGGVTDSVIADCTAENIGLGAAFGCGIRVSWGSSRNHILRNTIHNTGRGGIFGDNGSSDLVIRDNHVSGSGGEGLGLEVWGGCDRCVIEDNRIDHWLSIGGCDWCSVRRNVISDKTGVTKPYGLEIIGSYCIVTDNLVDEGQGIGISVSSRQPKNYAFYRDNTIRGCYHWGAQLQGEEGGIAYHYFYRCKFLDTLVGHPSVKYEGAEGNGFRTNGHVKHMVLEECEMRDNGRLGVQLGGPEVDFLSFVRCTVAGNKGAAVVGPGEYSALEWVDCTVEGNARDELSPGKPFPRPPPVADFEAPSEVVTGDEVTFTNRSGEVAMAFWDLGDGIPMVGEQVTHTYTEAGEYRVTLVVWDHGDRGGRVEKTVRAIREEF